MCFLNYFLTCNLKVVFHYPFNKEIKYGVSSFNTVADSVGDQPKITPHDLVKRADVEKALKADKGSTVELIDFKIVDFTQKGDNYACVVSSVVVDYRCNEEHLKTSYVVKLNPCRGKAMAAMSEVVFKKETGFYTDLLPLLNAELIRINEQPLRVARHFHSVKEPESEVIFLEDLRTSGYKLFPRKKGMDAKHTGLILQELARLHSSSVLLMSRGEYKGADMVEKIPILFEPIVALNEGEEEGIKFKDILPQQLDTGISIARLCKEYEKVVEYFTDIRDDCADRLLKLVLDTKPQFLMVTHGDCWTNNFLFR